MVPRLFSQIPSTMTSEDDRVEREILPEGSPHVMAVVGSGARLVSMLARQPERLTGVSADTGSLWLAMARVEALRRLSCEEYRAFLGYPGSVIPPTERARMFRELSLPEEARVFLESAFEAVTWESFLMEGRFERALARFASWNSRITGARGRELFNCATVEELQGFLKERFPSRRWSLFLMARAIGALGTRMFSSDSVPEALIFGGDLSRVRRAFDQIFHQDLPRRNFFLQTLFRGRPGDEQGCPDEADPEVIKAARRGLEGCQVRWMKGAPVELAGGAARAVHYLSLSHLSAALPSAMALHLLRRVGPGMSSQGIVTWRVPPRARWCVEASGFLSIRDVCRPTLEGDRMAMYQMEVYQKVQAR
jgi:S-adenosylmethionine-diacylglycerol 3-amino-3-carboxypropyl transferase